MAMWGQNAQLLSRSHGDIDLYIYFFPLMQNTSNITPPVYTNILLLEFWLETLDGHAFAKRPIGARPQQCLANEMPHEWQETKLHSQP